MFYAQPDTTKVTWETFFQPTSRFDTEEIKASNTHTHTHTHTHTLNGPLSGTTQVSWYQKGKTNLDLNEARVEVASAGPYASLHLAPDR